MSIPSLRSERARASARWMLLGCLTPMFLAAPATALIHVVNSVGDAADATAGNNLCDTGASIEVEPGVFEAECTLRAAIEEANGDTNGTIQFAANLDTGGGQIQIRPTSPLPPINREIVIDGRTAPGYDLADPWAMPMISIDGSLVGTGAGIEVHYGGGNSQILALAIHGFQTGIALRPAPGLQIGPVYVLIQGCQIGIRNGFLYPGNSGYGIDVDRARGATIGKECSFVPCAGKGNVISASGWSGIRVDADGARIAGNRIGTDVAGMSIFTSFGYDTRNGDYGVHLEGGTGSIIGGERSEAGNVISGSGNDGIGIAEGGNFVLSNYIGTNRDGTSILFNQGAGVLAYGVGNQIGSLTGGGNVIAGNQEGGVRDFGSSMILGNTIGLRADHTAMIGAQPYGIEGVSGGTEIRANTIGGSTLREILATGADYDIHDNWIGTTPAGDDFGVAGIGVEIDGGYGRIGEPGAPNVVGFHNDEIYFAHGSSNYSVRSNFIGVLPDGTNVGGGGDGIELHGGEHTIGSAFGLTTGEGNTIGFMADGIEVGSDARYNLIIGNFVGTDASGRNLGNLDNGIEIRGAADTFVGCLGPVGFDDCAREGNEIAYNGGVGVAVLQNTATGIAVRGNRFRGNVAGPVDLYDNGPTANDLLDTDTGPNKVMNHPTFDLSATQMNSSTGEIDIIYSVSATTTAAAYPLQVDFYLSTGNDGDPDLYFGSDTYLSSDATLSRSVSLAVPYWGPQTALLRAIATDDDGNTSEFSTQFVPVPEPGTASMLAAGSGLLVVLGARRAQRRIV